MGRPREFQTMIWVWVCGFLAAFFTGGAIAIYFLQFHRGLQPQVIAAARIYWPFGLVLSAVCIGIAIQLLRWNPHGLATRRNKALDPSAPKPPVLSPRRQPRRRFEPRVPRFKG